jgi:glycosyltransferase involved in cell wall biosynthesis
VTHSTQTPGHHAALRLLVVALEIVGAGSLRSELEVLVEALALRQYVALAGAVAAGQTAQHSDQTTVFVNASAVDNVPGSIMEAFAAGLPVVSTDAGGIPYLVRDGETGLLCA